MKTLNLKKVHVFSSSKKFTPSFSKGFTLIELLVIIGIVGILATIIIAIVLAPSKAKSNDAKILNQLSQMRSQSFLFVGTLGTAYVVPTPYLVSSGITGASPGGTEASGTLFNDTTLSNNSLYLLASKLPSSTYIYYGWDGADPNLAGRWFFAATTSTGAFCVDYTNEKKEHVGTIPSGNPSTWTNAFPNATAVGGYLCN